jgi:aldehyde dehydrogenase (NAD+)
MARSHADAAADVVRDEDYPMVVGGEYLRTDEQFPVVDPATEETIAQVSAGASEHVDRAVEVAQDAADDWQSRKPVERGRVLQAVADGLREERERLATLLTLENGKPLSEARSDVDGAIRYFEYYAGVADKIHGSSIPLGEDYVDYTVREPLGVTAHVVPWNFPVDIIGRSVAPALAAGNVAILKPAEQTPLTAVEVADIVHDAGVPPGAFNVLQGYGEDVGAPLVGHRGIDGVSFTGSVPTGQSVAKSAAENLVHVHIEAGGKNPNLVFPDANLDRAVDETIKSIFSSNAGQVCSAGDRAIVHESIHEEFRERLVDRAGDLTVGPGLDDPDIGPLVSAAQYDKVTKYVDVGCTEVGDPILGGGEHADEGYYVYPTVFDDVPSDTRIAHEEIFGPVLPIITFETEAEAFEIANATKYGLVAGIHTNDVSRAHRYAKTDDAGQVYVNEWYAGGVETPFGGYKDSGFGREKGLEALDSFTQVKNVCVNLEPSTE